jgi:hypothetical protein
MWHFKENEEDDEDIRKKAASFTFLASKIYLKKQEAFLGEANTA